jgi:subtilisin family serine protease
VVTSPIVRQWAVALCAQKGDALRHGLLFAGVTLGVGLLSVGLVVSGTPRVAVEQPLPNLLQTNASTPPARATGVIRSTNTNSIIVTLRGKVANPAALAIAAVKKPALAIAGVKVIGAEKLRSDAAEVHFGASITRTQANAIAAATQRLSGVKHADAELQFAPTDTGGDGSYWNVNQINASSAWATTKGNTDVVVGVIDTGIADNALLPKALLLNTVDSQVGGPTITGTTWPGLTVTLRYPSGGSNQTKTTLAAADGNWAVTLSPVPDDSSTLYASVADASGDSITTTSALVNSSTHLTVTSPSDGSTFTGSADTDATITVKNGSTTLCADLVPGTDRTWVCSVSDRQADKADVSVTATDALGNTDTRPITVDAAVALRLDASDGRTITGITDPGATVRLTTESSIVCSGVTANSSGAFTCTPTTRLADGTEVTATSVDALANSATAKVVVNASVNLSVVSPSSRWGYSGSVDSDATVTLTYPDSTTQTATVTGTTWAVTSPTYTAYDKDVISVTATDGLGNTDTKTITVDASVALSVKPSNGTSISGSTDPSSDVTFADDAGKAICDKKTADDNGDFSCSTDPLPDGTVVTVTSVDPRGNMATATIAVNASVNLQVSSPSNGKVFTGTADTDAKITITLGGATVCEDLAPAADRSWTCTVAVALADSSVVDVVATDGLGNSDTAQISVDAAAPKLTVDPSNGATISGSTDSDATVVATTKAAGSVCGTITVSSDGSFTCQLTTPLTDGTAVTVTATDPLGNAVEASVTVNASVNLTVVTPSSGNSITGTVDPDSTVTAKDSSGRAVCAEEITVTEAGSWTCQPNPALADKSVVTVTATDLLGNTGTGTITVDASVALVVDPSDGSSVSGTTDPGATVQVTLTAGAVLCESVAADVHGAFHCTFSQLAVATSLTLKATDALGNTTTSEILTESSTPTASPSANEAAAATSSVVAAASAAPLTTTTVGSGTVLPGYDFIGDDALANDDEGTYHGTHVAGIVAAQGSTNQPVGVAPNVKILPIRALGSTGTLTDVANAIRWGAGLDVEGTTKANPYPADVLNLSLSAQNTSCPGYLQEAINSAVNAGTVVVVSASNESASITNATPANCANVIVVTATTSAGARASYSNWGDTSTASRWLVAAPGGSADLTGCYSYHLGQLYLAPSCTNAVVSTIKTDFTAKSGTSMAAPHVAGTAALLKSLDPSLTPAEVATYIRGTATALSDGCPTGTCGSGIVNAAGAVTAVADRVTSNASPGVTVAVPANSYPALSAHASWQATTIGATVTATGASSYGGYTLQWLRNGAAIAGATGSTYVLTASDYLQSISVQITSSFGTTATSNQAQVARGKIAFTTKPKIAGKNKVGKTLTATAAFTPSYAPATRYYQWYRNGKKISHATKATYKLTKKDRGKKISVRVKLTAVGYYGPISKTSAKTKTVKR